jgi:hypothetical protein
MAKESFMLDKNLALLSALFLAIIPGAAAAEGRDGGPRDDIEKGSIKQDSVSQGHSQTGGQSYGDRNRGGPYGFYSYPRHRHIDGGSTPARRLPSSTSSGTSPWCDNCHGSAYYGRDYGAPYFGGGYYDRGVYYRERRER